VRVPTYAAVVVLAILALSLWTFWMAVRPPRLTIPGTPTDFRLPAEVVTITSDDGLSLSAWFIPAASPLGSPSPPRSPGPPAVPAVIVIHGYPANKADMLPMAGALHPHFATLLVDLRYFGGSEGRATTLGFRERKDVGRAVDFLERRGFTRIGAFGHSLGGAVALLAAAEDARLQAVAAQAPFADLTELGREAYAGLGPLKYPLVELMRLWSRIFLGGDITRPSPEAAAARLAIPILLLHSRDDEQVPFAHAERLREALARNPAAAFVFGRGLHNAPAPDSARRVVEFFRQHLG
jgi:uncharacterized protein